MRILGIPIGHKGTGIHIGWDINTGSDLGTIIPKPIEQNGNDKILFFWEKHGEILTGRGQIWNQHKRGKSSDIIVFLRWTIFIRSGSTYGNCALKKITLQQLLQGNILTIIRDSELNSSLTIQS